MTPGAKTSPPASIVSVAVSLIRPIAATWPPVTARSPSISGLPSPSAMRALRKTRSYMGGAPRLLEEAQEPVEHLIRRFLVDVVPGRQRLAADVLGALPPQGERIGEPLADAAAPSPQHQDRHFQFTVEVGGVELAIDRGGGAIIAAGAADRLLVEATDIFVPDCR